MPTEGHEGQGPWNPDGHRGTAEDGAVEVDECTRRVTRLGLEDSSEFEQAWIARCECECRFDIRQRSLPITRPSANSGAYRVGIGRIRRQRDGAARFGVGGRVVQGAQKHVHECGEVATAAGPNDSSTARGFKSLEGLAKICRSRQVRRREGWSSRPGD